MGQSIFTIIDLNLVKSEYKGYNTPLPAIEGPRGLILRPLNHTR